MSQPYYPFYWSDYSGDTFDLSQGQHGAYILLLRFIYTSGKRILHDQCYSIARASSEQEKANVDQVLHRYFKRDGEEWYHSRCDEVMAKADEAHQKRVNAGKQGGKAKAQRSSNATPEPEQSSSNQNQNQNQNHIGTDVPIKDIPGTVAVLFDGHFQTLWHAYLGIGKGGVLSDAYKGTRKKAQDAYFQLIINTKETDRETLIRDIADGAARYAEFLKQSGSISKYLSTWIGERGWETSYAVTVPADDQSRRGAGYGQKPSYSHSIVNAANRAIEIGRSRDDSIGRSGGFEGFPADDLSLPATV